ncbi:MAG: hypothetical protein ABIS18_01175 [Actinomycetota bacterium]
MSPDTTAVEKLVVSSVTKLRKRIEFKDWLAGQSATDGDLVVLNNSFIYRDKSSIKTRKNSQFIGLKVEAGKLADSPLVVAVDDFNSDFKLVSAKSENFPKTEGLSSAIIRELKTLGQLVFVLIGEIKDQAHETELNHAYASSLRFDPSSTGTSIEEKKNDHLIVISQLLDPESAWNEIEEKIQRDLSDDEAVESLSQSFAVSFERLKIEAISKLVLPTSGTIAPKNTFMTRVGVALAEQRKLYDQALAKYENDGRNPVHLNEVLRIAYNFADDALKVLHLLVSVGDLKAVLLWSTVEEHFAVAHAFKSLPWNKSTKKASLSKYQEVISGARNRAFHNLLAFDRTIESDLAGVSINARTLTLFPAHGRRKGTVPFDYEDRELVEVLSELTLAPETSVSLDFWKRNSEVMRCVEVLITRTEEALGLLNRVRN